MTDMADLEKIFGPVASSASCTEEMRATVEEVLQLAVEVAREGREGRKIGTLFVVGDVEAVLERSRPLLLDPLYGHPNELLDVRRPEFRETVKELAQLTERSSSTSTARSCPRRVTWSSTQRRR